MTTHGCGHCGETFEDRDELHDHVSKCDTLACLVCGEEFDDRQAKWDHDCHETSDGPFIDPEAKFRERRRKVKRRREFERKMRKRGEYF